MYLQVDGKPIPPTFTIPVLCNAGRKEKTIEKLNVEYRLTNNE